MHRALIGLALLTVAFSGEQSARAGDDEPLAGWHAANYYGFHQRSIPDFWDELCDVYGDGELDDVFEDDHGLWDWGYPIGYSIGAGRTHCWPFGPAPRCCLAPLHYRIAAPAAFSSPQPPRKRIGESWYRTASGPAAHGLSVAPVSPISPAPAPAP